VVEDVADDDEAVVVDDDEAVVVDDGEEVFLGGGDGGYPLPSVIRASMFFLRFSTR
jgi:hypothetical protein